MNLKIFSELDFLPALHTFFEKLNVPINHVADEPTTVKEILETTYKDNDTFRLTNEVYFVGMVDDASFKNKESATELNKIKSDYDGILIFGVTLRDRPNGLLPTRSQLAEIARAFNREFYYTPVVVVFKYNNHIAFANTERLKYKQEWREGEKVGKVTLLRDINIDKPHAGHHRILAELKIPNSGKNVVDSFAKLYTYWQEVLSVNILNKKFYQELSNWYFWAIQNVQFPGAPTFEEAHSKGKELDDLKQQHKATNVIRMLTRLLFVWFLKEKKLIPNELFELKALQQDILNEIAPTKQNGLFKEQNIDSVYYKAILQNLFFATLNCPIEGDSIDKRKRGFRSPKSNYGTMFLMRYEKYFKDKDSFLEMVNETVPFLNGGLFECLDERGIGEQKDERIWIDGFSDNLPKDQQLVVPDYLFFGLEEQTDLSDVVGISTREYKQAAVKGLINILESYKFTITENTPIEEDVALDPELLGKVFENLLASYNPETKTTARKQTGSFYTPREIVNYMVDESLIAYLTTVLDPTVLEASSFEKLIPKQDASGTLQDELRQLVSFDPTNPFDNNKKLTKEIIAALSTCTIIDPACGSGAFPMGILQKMVHILQKLDPDNKVWKEVQREKANAESEEAFDKLEDKNARAQRLIEINEAFDESTNDPDYARKLFLIENCIYGVDIQPIATQISKLRFFISLVVEQKVNPEKDNFGIRPLPNLETKFVAANTLIGIDRPKKGDQLNMFSTERLKELETELKQVRSKLFGAKTKDTKVKYRNRDEELRNAIATELQHNGWETDTAQKLAGWDPYDQNASSEFFDSEWMFDIKEGFDIVIANPPYIGHKGGAKKIMRKLKNTTLGKKFNNERMDIFYYFFHVAINISNKKGIISFITTNYFPTADSAIKLRDDIYNRTYPFIFVDFNELTLFESARGQHNLLSFLSKSKISDEIKIINIDSEKSKSENEIKKLLYEKSKDTTITHIDCESYRDQESGYFLIKGLAKNHFQINKILDVIQNDSNIKLGDTFNISQGVVTGLDKISPKHVRKASKYERYLGDGVYVISRDFYNSLNPNEKLLLKPWFKNSDIKKFSVNENTDSFVIHINANIELSNYPNIKEHLLCFKDAITLRNYESGELSRAKKMGAWWALSSSRRDFDFSLPKIVSPQRSYKNTFGYTKKEWCASADVYFITCKPKSEMPLECLLLILNSSLFYIWLYNRGKRKGEMLELYLTPLAAIPLPYLTEEKVNLFTMIGQIIIKAKKNDLVGTEFFQKIGDSIVIEHYFSSYMINKNIHIISFIISDIKRILGSLNFNHLSVNKKEETILDLYNLWKNPNNEVVKRIGMFREKSPDLLGVILDS